MVVGIAFGVVYAPLGFLACAGGFVGSFVLRSRLRDEARHHLSPSCATTTYAARYLGWSGTIQSFFFTNRSYAAEFMLANSRKLVNVTPEGYQVLQWAQEREHAAAWQVHEAKRAELQQQLAEARAAHDAAAQHDEAAKEEADLFKWISKVESAKGPAGRRAALGAGLAALARPDLQERLTIEAVEIEVRTALDKADTQKASAAKLRTLRAALEAVEATTLPQDAKQKSIRMLQDAIAQFERA